MDPGFGDLCGGHGGSSPLPHAPTSCHTIVTAVMRAIVTVCLLVPWMGACGFGLDGQAGPPYASGRASLAATDGDKNLCDDMDLSDSSKLQEGRYDKVAACQMEALRQGRPGRLVLYDRDSRWQVYTDSDGRQRVSYTRLHTGLDDSRERIVGRDSDDDPDAAQNCRVDQEFLARCYQPSFACLRPENWLVKCKQGSLRVPRELPEPGTCRPTAGPPHWLSEGEMLAVTIEATCRNGRAVAPGELRFDDLPPGATYDPSDGQLHWRPGLDQAGVYDLVFRLRKAGDPGLLRIGVADAFDEPDNVPIADPRDYPFEYGLPVFFLEDPEHDEYEYRDVYYAGHRYHTARIKVRGQTSRHYPKRSYTIKFDGSDLFQEVELGGGLTDRKKIVLISAFDDNAYVRQRLAHELWGLLDAEHVAVRAYNAIVYRDNRYRGLYTVADHVDRHLMRHHGLSEAGELFKSMTHDGGFLTKRHDMLKKEGLPLQGEPDWDASLLELIDFVRDSDDEAFDDRLASLIDVRDYQNWWVFMMATGATDSAGKNAYHYLEPGDAVFRAIPWDFNASFGQAWNTRRDLARDNRFHSNGIWKRMADSPTLRGEMRDRMLAALRGPYALEVLLERLDAYTREVAPSVERDWRRWEEKHRDFKGFRHRESFLTPAEEADYIREWLTERWAFLEENIDGLLAPEGEGSDEGRGSDEGQGEADEDFAEEEIEEDPKGQTLDE